MRRITRRALKYLDRLNPERLQDLVRELVEDAEQLEMVLSSIPDAVLVSGRDHKVTMVNAPALRLLPLASGDPVDMKAWEALASSDLSIFVRSALEEERSAPRRDFVVDRRGRRTILSCSILPLVTRGRIHGNFLYAEDVTEQRAEEARLRRAEGLASLTTMAAGVAHEIKNPLASMVIHLQLMRRMLDGDCADPDDLRESLDVLEEETERLNGIVMDYLFAVRPPQANPAPTDLNALLEDLVQFLRFEVAEAKVRVVMLPDDRLPPVSVDESSMKMAVLNLIKNALAAMPEGGELRLQTRFEGDRASISVADTGTGIPEELQGKIFEPYFTTKDSGSGLGLTVVYKVVRDHGGEIHMDSEPGRGTTFRIFLPVLQAERKMLSGGAP